jgi:hypothetical protein
MELCELSRLPEELIAIIFESISPKQKIFLNKQYYTQFNYLIDQIIGTRYDSYVRDIVRNNYAFSFHYLLERNFNKWLTINNYYYKQSIYDNYICFLIEFSRDNNAYKCINLLNVQLQLSRLKKEWYKNSRVKYNKWTN